MVLVEDRQQINKTEIDPHKYAQLLFDKAIDWVQSQFNGGKTVFLSSGTRTIGQLWSPIPGPKENIGLIPHKN